MDDVQFGEAALRNEVIERFNDLPRDLQFSNSDFIRELEGCDRAYIAIGIDVFDR